MGAINAAKRDSRGVAAVEGGSSRPGYYFLLPVTVPLDVATSPIQGIGWLMYHNVDNANH